MALIQQNLVPGTRDRLLTFDTETNVEWLDLTATLNFSYLDILGGLGSYLTTYGFRYATGVEIQALLDHAGVTKFGPTHDVPSPASNHAAIETLIELMGGRSLSASKPSGTILIQTQGMMKFQGSHTPAADAPTAVSQLWLFKNNPSGSYADTNPGAPAGSRKPESDRTCCATESWSSTCQAIDDLSDWRGKSAVWPRHETESWHPARTEI